MPIPLKPGDTFDRYTIDAVLGQGGMGVVYRAHDGRLDRRIALKIVQDPSATPEAQAQLKARVLREARAVAALDHPNAIAIHDVGEVDGTPYIVMELVDGRTLRACIEGPPTPLLARLGWLLDTARALAAAHKAGIVHRDVKPENVMVRADGRVKVLDFGIARRSASSVDATGPTQSSSISTLTAKGIQVGTPMYMAPEQIRGEPADGRSDQFSWAILAYELLEGAPPWRAADALGLVAAILTEEPPPMKGPDLPAKVRAIVLRALSKLPEERFGSMDDIIRLLAPLAGGAPAPSPSAPATPPASPAGGAGALGRTTDLRRYATEELREILQRALERQADDRKYSHADLVDAAREVGIDEAALREASRALPEPLVASPVSAERFRQRQRLLRHAGMWLVFSVFFLLLDLLTAGGEWFFFPVLAWGVGVAAHAVKYLFPVEPTPEERARQLHKMRRRLRRSGGEALERDLEEGVSLLLTSAHQRARVASPARLRVGAAARDELDAEAEEAAGEEAARDGSRRPRRSAG